MPCGLGSLLGLRLKESFRGGFRAPFLVRGVTFKGSSQGSIRAKCQPQLRPQIPLLGGVVELGFRV